MLNHCVIIPVYNHFEKIAAVVKQLRSLGLPCIILDDGSTETCSQTLKSVVESDPQVTLIRFEYNRGKGAVVCDGLRHAHSQGFSHALQVDADGQHDLSDVPQFLQAAERDPEAVISGFRAYGQLPVGRRYGRFFTDLWVWINTLSFHIKDSMCGYRLYPLAPSVALLSCSRVGQRMDFDTDILVRLFWRGVDIKHVSTRILYSDEITSHFRLFQDNVCISLMIS